MTNYQTAKLIPTEFRTQIVDDNVIYKAVVAPDDVQMNILVILYQNYIFTEGELVDMSNPCLACLSKILDIFKLLLPEFLLLEKDRKLLEDI
jgi:hypothetical protein